jgi:hypothetical protein
MAKREMWLTALFSQGYVTEQNKQQCKVVVFNQSGRWIWAETSMNVSLAGSSFRRQSSRAHSQFWECSC